ncbi:MAG: type II and III secretion system protein family protein [Marinosulfonomonas sp.]|nr:type II and III secretion system protein family protein [Marinosulfonomonas sp.]
MKMNLFIKAALLGFAVSVTAAPTSVGAETLRIMRGAASSALKVPMNRAVVVESDVPFAELAIANPAIADISTLSERTIYVLGKLPGRTTLTITGPDGRLITNVDVQVTPDVAEFKERLRQILPGEPIEVRTANDGIVLSGVVSSIARLDRALDLAERYAPERVSNLMSVGGTQQVMLKVRFAEMQRSVSKQLSAGLTFSGGGGSTTIVGGGGNGGLNVGPPATAVHTATGTAAGQAFIGFNMGSAQLGVLLEALETKGVVRTLAEPNLIALSGQEAKFLAGGEYPTPVIDDGKVGVEFKPFGIALNFTPRVVDGDIINLSLTASVSSVDTANGITVNGTHIDAFRTRETTTTVEMRDGESFAIAGLLQDDFRDVNTQVPWLGDIPILGTLFRSTEYQRAQSELVIIITPHLVTPTHGEALALPTDRIRIPTESELFLFGKVAGRKQQGAAGEVARQDFTGSYGYVME